MLNFQPVIPISLGTNWNLITRWILPIINQPSPAPGIPSAFGLGNFNPTFFVSPANSGKLTWGLGPTFTFPTATDSVLGNGKWSAGPSVVALLKTGPWLAGALANNQWSYAGWGNKDVNAMLVQPFVNYNFKHGWYLTTSPIITADWKASHENMWVVPVGGGGGKIIKLGGSSSSSCSQNDDEPLPGGLSVQSRTKANEDNQGSVLRRTALNRKWRDGLG